MKMRVCPCRASQSGMSLLAAIFVLMLLSSIAASIVHFSSTAHTNSMQDFEGSRAYQAARAGVEWGLFQLDPNDATSTLPNCFADTDLLQFAGYTVRVTCTPFPDAATTYQEGPRQIRMFQIVAVARSIAAFPTQAEREIAVTVEKCRDPAFVAAPFGC